MWTQVGGCAVIALAMLAASCNATCNETCPLPPKHYAEIGCKPIVEEDQCCPKRYACPALTDRDGNKCYLNGNIYEAGAKLSKEDQEMNSCSPGCFCSNLTSPATFTCAHIDCPEFFEEFKEGCIRQYKNQGCCASSTVCGAEAEKLPRCYFEGEMYYEGQRMYPKEETCWSCLCAAGYDNSTIAGNPHCQEVNCGIELHSTDRLAMGCIPIYFGNDRCCPISWRCPEDSDAVITDGRNDQDEQDVNQQCTFGKLKLNKGDAISSDDKCVDCKCVIPPMAHCIRQKDC